VPLRPPLPGIDDPRIFTLRSLVDMDRIKAAAAAARRVTVIGAGFIGLEMAEQFVHLGKRSPSSSSRPSSSLPSTRP
jgi:NADPH-dependent 2,4-dienoyl-CoA reductase/sulfur reductase-like enzyme